MSNNLDLPQLAGSQNSKHITINDQAAAIDSAITEFLSVDLDSANVTLTNAQYREHVAFVVDCSVASRFLDVPLVKKLSVFVASDANTEPFTLRRGASLITMRPGDAVTTYSDATTDGLRAILRQARATPATVATLPSAALRGAGGLLFVSDEAGGSVLAFSDGTNWRRVTDRAIVS